MRSRQTNLIYAMVQASTVALISASVLAACGSKYGSRGASRESGLAAQNTTMGTLPEAQGSMQFQPAKYEPAPAGSQMTGVASDKSDDGLPSSGDDGLSGLDTKQSPRHDICAAEYDPSKKLPPQLTCARCETGSYTQPGIARKKLDILFVADTSPSLSDTREKIAKSVSKFVAALPDNTDYNFAVLPAHGDKSYDDKKKPSSHLGGKIFANPNEPYVLKYSDYHSMAALTQVLEHKLLHMPIDPAPDGGEIGMYSLNLAIQEPYLSQNRAKGFFRPDAALAVIFISDENDICSRGNGTGDYPFWDAAKDPQRKATPWNNKDPDTYSGPYNNFAKGADAENVEEVAYKFYCTDGNGTPTVDDKIVYDHLRQYMKVQGSTTEGRPLIISGVIYTDPKNVPTTPPAGEPFPQYFVEKEVGHGYLEMIQASGGQAADMSADDYDDGLGAIGKQAAIKLQVKSQFQLKDGVQVDPNSLCVMVNGKEATGVEALDAGHPGFTYTYNQPTREVLLQGVGATDDKGSPSKVDIFYCEPPSVTSANPELYSTFDLPTIAEHYKNLPVPSACRNLKAKISSGALNNG